MELEQRSGFWPTGHAGICVKDRPGVDEALATASASLGNLPGAEAPRLLTDSYGYRWLLVQGEELGSAATQVRVALSALADAGFAGAVACAPFSFQAAERGPLYLVFLPARGGFYPFVPTGPERRDNLLEVTVAGELEGLLNVESEKERWFPIYDCPVEAPA